MHQYHARIHSCASALAADVGDAVPLVGGLDTSMVRVRLREEVGFCRTAVAVDHNKPVLNPLLCLELGLIHNVACVWAGARCVVGVVGDFRYTPVVRAGPLLDALMCRNRTLRAGVMDACELRIMVAGLQNGLW